MDLSFFTEPQAIVALLTLAGLEIVLGIDNIIFIAIVSGKLDDERARKRARNLGIALAALMRIGLLLGISWIMSLDATLFTIAGIDFSGKSLILFVGGVFLVAKSVIEIHHKLETPDPDDEKDDKSKAGRAIFWVIILQILLIDMVFSLDSVITAVGMVDHVEIAVIAILIATTVMIVFAGPVARFVEKYPTLKILALAFLILIGVMLVIESLGYHVPKMLVYVAMGFGLAVELMNIRFRKVRMMKLKNSQLPDSRALAPKAND